MFPSENFTERSKLYDAYEEYAENQIREVWGLSIAEYLDQPQFIVRMMREQTKEILARKTSIISDIQNDVKNSMRHKK